MIFLRTIFFTVFTVSLVIAQLEAMNQQPQMQTIHDVPAYYVNIAKQLNASPIITYGTDMSSHFFKLKTIQLKNAADCEISVILSDNTLLTCQNPWVLIANKCYLTLRAYDHLMTYADDFVELVKTEMSIMHWGWHEHDETSDLYHLAGFFVDMIRAGEGSQEYVDRLLAGIVRTRRNLCAPEELEEMYEKLVQSLRKNWIYTSAAKEYFLHYKSKFEWSLFIKSENLIDKEGRLIRCLIEKFGLKKSIECENVGDSIYLWVKKDAVDEFKRVFDLEIK